MMRRRGKRRILKWSLWTIGVLGLVLAILGLIEIDDVVMAQGIVEPGQKIYIDSPLKRVIHQVLCEPGTLVKAGQVVVKLYDSDLQSAVSAAEKEVQRAEANLEFAAAHLALLKEKPTREELKIAESQLEQAQIAVTARKQDMERAEHLYLGERLWSQEDLERATTNHELSRTTLKVAQQNLNLIRRGASPAELRQAEAELRQSVAALDKSRNGLEAAIHTLELATLRSPVDGIVARRDLHPGMLADQGQIVLIIAGAGAEKVIDAWVPETNAWKIRLGHPVEILSNLFADREEFIGQGEVAGFHGYAVHGGGARTFELEVKILASPLPLKFGSTADLRIIVGRRSILKILLGIEDLSVVQASRDSNPDNLDPREKRNMLPDAEHGQEARDGKTKQDSLSSPKAEGGAPKTESP
jgi:multidrug resistance efflux pump